MMPLYESCKFILSFSSLTVDRIALCVTLLDIVLSDPTTVSGFNQTHIGSFFSLEPPPLPLCPSAFAPSMTNPDAAISECTLSSNNPCIRRVWVSLSPIFFTYISSHSGKSASTRCATGAKGAPRTHGCAVRLGRPAPETFPTRVRVCTGRARCMPVRL